MTLSTCILQQVLLTSVNEADTTKTTLYHLGRSGNEADTAPGEKFSNFKSTVPLQVLELRAPTIYKAMCALEMSVLAHSDTQAQHP